MTAIETTIELAAAPIEPSVDPVAAAIELAGAALVTFVESTPCGTVETTVRDVALAIQTALDPITAIGSFGTLLIRD